MLPFAKDALGPKAISTVCARSVAFCLKFRNSGVMCTILNQISGSVRLDRRLVDRDTWGATAVFTHLPMDSRSPLRWPHSPVRRRASGQRSCLSRSRYGPTSTTSSISIARRPGLPSLRFTALLRRVPPWPVGGQRGLLRPDLTGPERQPSVRHVRIERTRCRTDG